MTTQRWALVDVETTGLSPHVNRVLSVACRTVEADGRVSAEWSTLVDPGCDPGPVHIHGITRERLRGAPSFDHVADELHRMVEGRVLVAHNAKFDHAFLRSEARRHGRSLPVVRRLCTLTASRRLDLPVENYGLASLARYWGVRQERAHDALDDVRVLSDVFAHTRAHASRLGIALPVLACGEDDRAAPAPVTTDRAPRVPSAFVNPPPWLPGTPLVQGAKVVITGDTRVPRPRWYARLVEVGLNPMNNVSGQTRLLLNNDPARRSAKVQRAQDLGVPVVTETELEQLLMDGVRPGLTPEAAAARSVPRRSRPTAAAPRGPWAGRVVMVLGGNHDEAAAARSVAAELGARVLVSLGASTTHVVALAGAENDRRWSKVEERRLIVLGSDLADRGAVPPPLAEAVAASEASLNVLVRGQTVDLPTTERLALDVSWAPGGPVVDLVAFVLGGDGRVRSDDDFVFYNQPVSRGVTLDLDGDAEQGIALDLDEIGPDVERVRVVAVIDGNETFGAVGPVAIGIGADDGAFATSLLDAASVETALVLAEVYRRGDAWRVRVVGRGHEQSLGQLAREAGVDVNG